jgi:hypothetical protein
MPHGALTAGFPKLGKTDCSISEENPREPCSAMGDGVRGSVVLLSTGVLLRAFV